MEMTEIKNIVTEMKTAFYGLIKKLDTAKERTSVLEDRSINYRKENKMRKNGEKIKIHTNHRIQELGENIKRYDTCVCN